MISLSANTVLFRAPLVRVTMGNEITVDAGARTLITNERALAILTVFAHPTTFSDGMGQLGATGQQDWMDLSTALLHLVEIGALRSASAPDAFDETTGFAAAHIHIAMLNDSVRTLAFMRAIRDAVRPDDVVLDIGTGTGVLAVAAAKAGARRVYAVEETVIGESAKALFRSNGVEDRVTLIAGRSSRISIPERATVLVSELLGNDIFDEQIIPVIRDARERLLTPDARLIPSRVSVFALPLEVPPEEYAKYVPDVTSLRRWTTAYDMEFAGLTGRQDHKASVFLPAQRTRTWIRLGPPVRLTEIDLGLAARASVEGAAVSTMATPGALSGFLLYFNAELNAGLELSMHPDTAGAESSWKSKIFLLPRPSSVEPGERFQLRYSFQQKSQLDIEPLS